MNHTPQGTHAQDIQNSQTVAKDQSLLSALHKHLQQNLQIQITYKRDTNNFEK